MSKLMIRHISIRETNINIKETTILAYLPSVEHPRCLFYGSPDATPPRVIPAMTTNSLHGVIAAVATAVDNNGVPDSARSTALARFLLSNGCDGLNVLGTTGEATSFSLDQRKKVMNDYAASGLPLDRHYDRSPRSAVHLRQAVMGNALCIRS